MAGSLDPPRDLTIPEAGSTTARDVLSRAVGRLMNELRALVRDPAALPMPRADAIAFQSLVMGSLTRSPGAVASVLRRPTVGVLLRTLRSELRADGDRKHVGVLLSEIFATLALELAAIGAMSTSVRATRLPARLLSLGARLAIDVAPGTAGIFEDGAVTLEAAGGRTHIELTREAIAPSGVTRPYHPVATMVLALADNNPLAMTDAHPDKQGNAIDLGGHSIEAWRASLEEALALIDAHLPGIRGEMDLSIHQLVPVGYDEERHLSASYQEALGTIYLTLHPSLMTMVEALIHEFSHNKLNALFETDDVLENAWAPLYTSPVRPDPRPLHGVLLAVHAFLPVARLYEAMIASGHPCAANASFRERFAHIRAINREGAEVVLSNARATRIGQGLIDEIRRWDTHFQEVT